MYKKAVWTLVLCTVLLAGAVGAEEDLRLRTFPNPFTAGYDEAKIAYYLSARATVSIYVYDIEGNRLRTVLDQITRRRGNHNGHDVWDGRNDEGEFVPAGPYLVVLDVRMQGERFRDTFITVVNR